MPCIVAIVDYPMDKGQHMTYLVAVVYCTYAYHNTLITIVTASLDNISITVWASFVRPGGYIAHVLYFTHLFLGQKYLASDYSLPS